MSNTQDELRCNVCLRQFDRPSRLHAHYQTHTGERPFNCLYCEKSFSSKGNCNTHMRVHTKEKPYGCPHCDKKFSQHGQLVIHKRTHTGEKPYICTQCNKGFTCSKVLKIHIRTHTGEKPFTCEYCPKTFAAYANLVVHRRIHTRERPYSCRLCARAFEHSGNLARHVRGHQVSNGIRCIPCGQVFQEESELMSHTLHEHPSDRDEDEESEEGLYEVSNLNDMSSISVVSDLHSPDAEEGGLDNTSMTVEISENCILSSELSTIDTNALELTAVGNLNFGVTGTVHENLENQAGLVGRAIHQRSSENNSNGNTGMATREEHYESLQNNPTEEANLPVTKDFSPDSSPGLVPTKRKSNFALPKFESKKINNRNLVSLPNLIHEYDRTTTDLVAHHARCSPNLSSRVTQMSLVDIESLPDIPENVHMISPTITNIPIKLNNSLDHGILLDLSSTATTVLPESPLNLTNGSTNGSAVSLGNSFISSPDSIQSHATHEKNVVQVLPSTTAGRVQNASTKRKGKIKKSATVIKHRKIRKKTNPPDLIPLDQHESNKNIIKTISEEIVIDDDDEAEVSPTEQFRLTNRVDCRSNRYFELNSFKNKSDSKDDLQKRLNVKKFHDDSFLSATSDHNLQRIPTQKYNFGGNLPENGEARVQITNDIMNNRFNPERRFLSGSSGDRTNINPTGLPRFQAPSQDCHFSRPLSPGPASSQVGRYQPVGVRSCPPPFVSDAPGASGGSSRGEQLPMSLDTLRAQIKRSVLSMVPNGAQVRDEFKHKAESAMLFLLGEESMRQLGFPNKNIEQVLISILDGAGMQPCADVRVDESKRLKYNLRLLLEYSFPDPADWEQFNWRHQPIETIVDTIASWRERGQLDHGFRISSGGLTSGVVNSGRLGHGVSIPTETVQRRYTESGAEPVGSEFTAGIRRVHESRPIGGQVISDARPTRSPMEFGGSDPDNNAGTAGNHQALNNSANSAGLPYQANVGTTRATGPSNRSRLPSLFQGGIRNLLSIRGLEDASDVCNNIPARNSVPNTGSVDQATPGAPTGDYRYYGETTLTGSR